MRFLISCCLAGLLLAVTSRGVLANELQTPAFAPHSFSSISSASEQLRIPIVASLVIPPEWLLASETIVTRPRDLHSLSRGYIFYSHNWQVDSNQLIRTPIGDEITLHFQHGRPKKFVIQNVFSLGPKSPDRSELAQSPDTLLIYSTSGYPDRDRLVLLAKELPTTEVSSL